MSKLDFKIFIQTNHKQIIGAKLAEYAIRRYSRNLDKFSIHILNLNDYPYMTERNGQKYLKNGHHTLWINDDLQSFTLTRFLPPEIMNYAGRALVIDPDVFACVDIWNLLSQDMNGKAIVCRNKKRRNSIYYHTSVMLLDCEKLCHWNVENNFTRMFNFELDYADWITLKFEDPTSIGDLNATWNDYDHLDCETKMLHNTKRATQPWKTGLPIDWTPSTRFFGAQYYHKLRSEFLGKYGGLGCYKPHPDKNQENFVFGLLKEALATGFIDVQFVQQQIDLLNVRKDALNLVKTVPDLLSPDAHPFVRNVNFTEV